MTTTQKLEAARRHYFDASRDLVWARHRVGTHTSNWERDAIAFDVTDAEKQVGNTLDRLWAAQENTK